MGAIRGAQLTQLPRLSWKDDAHGGRYAQKTASFRPFWADTRPVENRNNLRGVIDERSGAPDLRIAMAAGRASAMAEERPQAWMPSTYQSIFESISSLAFSPAFRRTSPFWSLSSPVNGWSVPAMMPLVTSSAAARAAGVTASL